MRNSVLVILFTTMVFIACRDDNQVDVQAPVIQSVTINDQTIDAINVSANTEIVLSVTVSDNTDLNQLRVTVTPNDNTNPTPNTGLWDELEIRNITGTSSSQMFTFSVPDSISGNWKLSIDCTDDLGNTTSFVNTIDVVNANSPVVTGSTNPIANASGVVLVPIGTNLIVNGELSDSDNFVYIKVYLTTLSGIVLSNVDVQPLLNSPMEFSGASFDNALIGNYRLVIEAKDQLGYVGKWGSFVNVQ